MKQITGKALLLALGVIVLALVAVIALPTTADPGNNCDCSGGTAECLDTCSDDFVYCDGQASNPSEVQACLAAFAECRNCCGECPY